MNIWHCERVLLDAGQKRDIGDLFQAIVAYNVLQHFLRRINPARHPHPRFVRCGKLPKAVVDFLQGIHGVRILRELRPSKARYVGEVGVAGRCGTNV